MAAKKSITAGKIYISASFNNTLVTVTDEKGAAIVWGSSGASGFKGTRKATPFAATTAVEKVIKKAKDDYGLSEVEIYVKGPGPGRDAALRAIRAQGIKISLIADITPIPHNGPRPKKKRRV
ncbi:MAG: 30S ribosomal protein S11 [Candidatus Woesebacteria bacterium GW2011_GWC2_47_16]|uniref:Small ribosomal subunit protein uS11 n=9 Tax=Candidatus Woeseibacteriota TaxID=1752722 RepID=A0A0G1QR53_9BACT|nr:MAG: 30S ribosomal protein S11 [Candidatus Woesebacteria bacterium GW2011_GWE1_45_18]KKU23855.1 MAG: 30S ribosomal protein S11 [Candidatus Woesebacteria bacterium GW2011_GWF1_46_13]KKU47367.1 MAG: 30S ribosomal protein S11 [Candidatus Woesebacteria bacterium GW2011_GWF2_46_8]KKU63052.1 MAG: 30S ribosomal protein S11 [Candidatus Woesebacteria bacterium GW2011_GWC2_47_16]KKU70026.1 MAG: 30S ribosomal protein S11 [Candidatus Woesebacteria bacterium GW2011_GWD1_47_21]OGM78796.1 MAG: 30S ribosom